MANKHMKMFKSLVIREMQIETTRKYHYIPIRIANVRGKEWAKPSARENVELNLSWNCQNDRATSKNSLAVSENGKHILTIYPSNPTLSSCSREMKTQKIANKCLYSSFIHNCPKLQRI